MSEPRLTVRDPQGQRVVVIDKPLFTIGRRTAADLYILSTDVSREHAEIARDGDQYILRDRGSRFGTFVNGEPVTARALAHGDRIRLGRTDAVELQFEADAGVTSGSGLLGSSTDVTDLRQMAAILNGLRAVGSGRVLEEVLTLVIDSALEVTKAERGFIMLANAQGALEFKVARAGGMTLTGDSVVTSTKIPREVFQTGRSRLVADLMEGLSGSTHDGTIAVGIRHVLCVPLRVGHVGLGAGRDSEQHTMGVLYLDGRERATMLSKATLSSLEAFATQASLAIDSARLYAESAEKARIEHDLRRAAEIQRALLPDQTYDSGAIELAAASIPCRTVGGDFFDYLALSDGAFGFALGDVAGKGSPAALLAAAVQSHFGALAPVCADPADVMARINRALLRRAIEARFATMFYGVVTPGGDLLYCNAGQEPPIVVSGETSDSLEEGGPVLGLLGAATYEYGTAGLQPGDLVVVCSDGVTEARNTDDEEFGIDRVIESVRQSRGASAVVILETLLAAVRAFTGGSAQSDDLTALVLRYRGGAPAPQADSGRRSVQ